MKTILETIDQEYQDALTKLQQKWEVSSDEYENLRSTWVINRMVATTNHFLQWTPQQSQQMPQSQKQ